MKRIFGVVLATCFVTACAQKVWHNADVTTDEANRDFATCRFASKAYTSTVSQTSGFYEAMRQNELMSLCMESKGYTLFNKEDLIIK